MNPWLQDDGSAPEDALRKSLTAAAAAWARYGKVGGALLENVGSSAELTSLWDDLVARAVDALAAKIDQERSRGIAPPGTDSRVLAAVIARGVQNILYLGLHGTHPELPSLTVATDAILKLWVGAVYGRRDSATPATVDEG